MTITEPARSITRFARFNQPATQVPRHPDSSLSPTKAMTQPTHNAPLPDPNSTTPSAGEGNPKPDNEIGVVGLIFVFLGGLLLMTTLVGWIFLATGLYTRWVPYTLEDWGTVQTIRYVGSLGPSTQLDTDRKTFRVWGTVNIDKGTRVVRRQDYFRQEICIEGTTTCWTLIVN